MGFRLLIKVVFFLFIFSFSSCKNEKTINRNKSNIEDDIASIKDSLDIFDNVILKNIKGVITNENFEINFQSTTEDEFFTKLVVNIKDVRFFSRQIAFNENIELKKKYRFLENDLLCNQNQLNNREKKCFYHSVVNNFLIVQRIHFEDNETIIIDTGKGKKIINLLGTSISVNQQDNFVFYNNNALVAPDETTEIVLYKFINNKIEKVFSSEVKWFTFFSFFDKGTSTIYYIHSYYDEQYNIISTYAKMNIIPRW